MKVYVLGSSHDLDKLDKKFFDENITVGVNQTFKRAMDVGSHLKYWTAIDNVMKFFDWICSDESANTVKFVPNIYNVDVRLFNLHQGKIKRGEMDLRTFTRRHFNGRFLVQNVDKMDAVVIDELEYSIFSGISIAVGLGATEIVLRGVSLGGTYFDGDGGSNRPEYYENIRKLMQGKIIPVLTANHIQFRNETGLG
jgi:hypothetical protein